MRTIRPNKLVLNRETLRALNPDEMSAVAGAGRTYGRKCAAVTIATVCQTCLTSDDSLLDCAPCGVDFQDLPRDRNRQGNAAMSGQLE